MYGLESQPEAAIVVASQMHVFFGAEQKQATDPETQEEKTVWSCSYVTVPATADYGDIVSAVIGERYSMDDQYAILANHADNPEETKAEYDAFQAWRAEAKQIAKAALTYLNPAPNTDEA